MKRIMSAALLLLGAAACGGGSAPKEYVFAITNPTTVAGPNADCSEAASQNVTVVSFNTDGHVIIYQGDSTHWYLEYGSGGSSVTLEGTANGSTYTFSGETDVEDKALNNPQTDDVKTSTISITIKDNGGNNVTGTFTQEDKEICQNIGGNNAACNFVLPPSGNTIDCITTGNIQGVALSSPQYKSGQTTPGEGGGPGSNF